MSNRFEEYLRKVNQSFDRYWQNFTFCHSLEASDAKAEVLMQQAIEAMHASANALTGIDEDPIPTADRKAACLNLCANTFDRLQDQWRVIAERQNKPKEPT